MIEKKNVSKSLTRYQHRNDKNQNISKEMLKSVILFPFFLIRNIFNHEKIY